MKERKKKIESKIDIKISSEDNGGCFIGSCSEDEICGFVHTREIDINAGVLDPRLAASALESIADKLNSMADSIRQECKKRASS